VVTHLHALLDSLPIHLYQVSVVLALPLVLVLRLYHVRRLRGGLVVLVNQNRLVF
jgi:hypothetical protein